MRVGVVFMGAAAAVLAGCAGRACRERGWIGGTLRPVRAHADVLDLFTAGASGDPLVGVPDGSPAACGLLVRDVPCDAPLATAGVARGDLLLALDGRPVGDAEEFRGAIEARRPGSVATLDVWRDGVRARHVVTVGRERFRREGTLALGLTLSTSADLNPLDDGISVFGLVQARSSDVRHDLGCVEGDYLRKVAPRAPRAHVQEVTKVGVFPLYVGAQTRVLSQEPVASR